MKVLHVVGSFDPRFGGPSIALTRLGEAQARHGLEVTVVGSWVRGEDLQAQQRLRDAGVEVHAIGPCHWPLRQHHDLGPTLDGQVPLSDIVHIHALWEQVQHDAAVLSRRHDVPYIFRPCGMLDPWSLRQKWLKKKLYMMLRLRRDLNGAAALHYTSEVERDLAAPLGLRPPGLVVPNGVDLSEFHSLPSPGFLRNRFPQIGARQIVLFLSRIHPKKGLDILLPAFARSGTKDRALVITGPDQGGHEAEIRRLSHSLGLDQSVVFTGPLYGPERVAALVEADLFVLPSRQENFGIAVVEALAAGVPVLISDQVNIHREIQQAGVGGVVRLDVDELARELNRWLSDQSLRTQAAQRAGEFARENYDWAKIAQRWVGEYERLIAGAAGPHRAPIAADAPRGT